MATYKKMSPEWKEKYTPILKEKLAGMMDNRFIKDAKRIQTICWTPPTCDVGVGVDKYIAEMKIDRATEGLAEEIREFLNLHREFPLDFIVEVMEA